ncbi:MAG: hypothetical protein JSS68_14135 [Actinobacteria bacterium]|nr:hypothetical protein [Actinomycetota bacterium]MBS1884332.1 hypothetical protein [Actinomycetota bacterium]
MGGFQSVGHALAETLAFVRTGAGHGIAVWVLAIVLFWSAVPKLRNPMRAAVAISDFRLVSTPRRWQGALLGATEMALGLFLASGAAPGVALAGASVIFLAFAATIARSLLIGEQFPCYCFGGEDDSITVLGLLRATALGALAILLLTAPGAVGHPGVGSVYLEAIGAAAVVGSFALVSQYRKLLGWNADTVNFLRRIGEAEL